MSDTHPSLTEIVGDVFDVEPSEVNDDTSPETMAEWDSLGAVRLSVALQEAYEVTFSTAELLSMRNVKKIRRVLRKRGIAET